MDNKHIINLKNFTKMKKETVIKILKVAATVIGMIIGFLGGNVSAQIVNNLIF